MEEKKESRRFNPSTASLILGIISFLMAMPVINWVFVLIIGSFVGGGLGGFIFGYFLLPIIGFVFGTMAFIFGLKAILSKSYDKKSKITSVVGAFSGLVGAVIGAFYTFLFIYLR